MNNTGGSRVHYFPRQILRTQDFQDEQSYHVAAHRRHNIAQHLWGIVSGLELTQDKDQRLYVTPGIAIDGFGREVVLSGSASISATAFDERLADALDVWALYARRPGDDGVPSYQPCERAATRSPYRWIEGAAIEWTRSEDRLLVDPDLGIPECRQPPGVSEADLSFEPFRTPPDDPSVRWPVFLGRVERLKAQGQTTFAIDMGGRPYAGARAEAIMAPSREAWIQVGTACGQNGYRFAVFLGAEGRNPADVAPRLALSEGGDWTVIGDAAVDGDVRVDGGAVAFGRGEAYATRKPWRIYRVANVETRRTGEDAEQQVNVEELRIEMAEHGAATGAPINQVTIGVWSTKENAFKPCLTVADDCTVTVHGDLIVEGTVNPQTRVEAALSAQSAALAVGAAASGVMTFHNVSGFQPIERLQRRAPPSLKPDGPKE